MFYFIASAWIASLIVMYFVGGNNPPKAVRDKIVLEADQFLKKQ